MVHAEKEDTEFRDYSSATEGLFFMRRGRLKILISVEKSMQDIPIDEKQMQPALLNKDLQALISKVQAGRINELNGTDKENAKP